MPRVPTLFIVALLALGLSVARTGGADWSPQLAAQYLDARQQAWFAWKPAMSPNGPCVSCHTGMTYLMARPALRRALGQKQPTPYERGLLDRLRSNVGAKPPGALQDVEVIFTALFLAEQDAGRAMSADTRMAFDQLWTLQRPEGPAKGAWQWYSANLDPWENPGSLLYGAALAAMAVGTTPTDSRRAAPASEQTATLTSYLASSTTPERPLHDRLAVLWASSKLPEVLPEAVRTALVAETFAKQSADGGWSIDSIGPWAPHAAAPPAAGSSSYATGFVAFALQRSGIPSSDPRLVRALGWLRSQQQPDTGAWAAVSMNKRYPPGSMEALFMQDAATAFASMALLEGGR
jgi:squalene-hopene/tetraprenyl-beta-curcumene cyclase